MKLIDIFLGSSIMELKEERQAFTEIVAELNTKLKKTGCVLYLNLCEQLSGHLNQKTSQQMLDETVLNSQYSYFIVRTRLGEYTQHEFDIALNQFYQCGRPKLSIMFSHSNEHLSEDALLFQERLKQIGYYYKEYQNKEEIKLNVVLNLVIDDILLANDLSVEDGGIYIGSTRLINTEQIPIYSRHSQLCELRKQLTALEQQEQNTADKRDRRIVREAISGIVTKIRDIEKLIYQTMLGLTKAGRGQMTPLLTRATVYLECGDIEKAAEILNVHDVTDELSAYQDKTEISLVGLQAAIDTTYIAIETMMQMPESLERTQQIETLFQRIIALEIAYNLNRTHCGLYVRYLLQRKKIDQAEKYILLYLEAPDLRIDTLQDFIASEYALMSMHIFLEPWYKKDPLRYQNLYVRTAYSYIHMYSKALEKLKHDLMNVNPRMMGIHCDRLLDILQNWIGEKDEQIQTMEAQLRMQIRRLQNMGYRKVDISKLDGAQEAKKLIAQMELRAECEKLNEEPQTDNPKEYLEQYAVMAKNLLDFFETSDNMFTKNNPVICKISEDYDKMLTALQEGNASILPMYAQIKICHAEHFVKTANFDVAVKDYREAYNTLKSIQQPNDLLCNIMLSGACSGLAITLSQLGKHNEAEIILQEGINYCQEIAKHHQPLNIMLARMHANYVVICIFGRIHDCISKGLVHAKTAYHIFDTWRNTLQESDLLAFSRLCTAYSELLIENGMNDEAYCYLLEAMDLILGFSEKILEENYGFVEHTVILSVQTGLKLHNTDILRPKLDSLYGEETTRKLLDGDE